MRWLVPLFLVTVACSGDTDDTTFVGPETCDDGIDNNGNGLVDCADTAFCGGLACATGDDDDDDDDTAAPPPVVEVIYSADDCCDFAFGPGDCPMSIGTLQIANRSVEADGEMDVSCDLVDGESPIVWQLQGGTEPPNPFIVNAPLLATSQVTVEAFYNCAVTHGFQTSCRAIAEVEGVKDSVEFQILAQPEP